MYLQVESKDHVKAKRRSDEEFLERLEQVQLAEEYVLVYTNWAPTRGNLSSGLMTK